MEFQLRPWRIEDAADVVCAAHNFRIAANLRDVFPYPYTLEDARSYLKSCIQNQGKGQLTRAIVVQGKAAGSLGLFVGQDVYRRSAEIGYWLAEDFWGRGIMTRAVTDLCREGFETFDLVRIYAEPFARNDGSRRVLEKVGFTLEGIMRKGAFKNRRRETRRPRAAGFLFSC